LYPEKQFMLLILLAVLLGTSSPDDLLWRGYTHGAALALAFVSMFLAVSEYVKDKYQYAEKLAAAVDYIGDQVGSIPINDFKEESISLEFLADLAGKLYKLPTNEILDAYAREHPEDYERVIYASKSG
jgi:hypothetical protein